MVKHILTTKCPLSCSYCITKNINIEEKKIKWLSFPNELNNIYTLLSKNHDSIMFTGGEPTMANDWVKYLNIAKHYFRKVFITTINYDLFIGMEDYWEFDAIIYSLHNKNAYINTVKNGATVYCSILADQYDADLPKKLFDNGFAGLTIRENHFGTEIFDESQLPLIEGFSIKLDRRRECFKKGTVYIMPDLSIRASFEEFL